MLKMKIKFKYLNLYKNKLLKFKQAIKFENL